MKIGVIAPQADPPVAGGHERALEGLVTAFREHTPHEAELVAIPVRERTMREVVDAYHAFAELDVARFDLVITSKYPAWLVRHPQHVVFMFHRLRGLYDTYHVFGLPTRVDHHEPDLARFQRLLRAPTGRRETLAEIFAAFDDLVARRGADDPAFAFPGPLARELVHVLDAVGLDQSAIRRFFALSQTVAARPGNFPPGARVEVVYTPPFSTGIAPRDGRHFFTVSRLDAPKRIDLIVRAMEHVGHDVPLKIAGGGPELGRLRALAARDPRIELLGRVADDELDGLYADALAVPFVPYDEDLGLVALEAMARGKPVVTCRDSGGPTEFVRALETGLVTDPSPAAIGAALERLADDPGLARRLGAEACESVAGLGWERTVRSLLRAPRTRAPVAKRAPQPKVVVLSTYAAARNGHGGQQRLFHLSRGLAEDFDVEILVLGEDSEFTRTETLAPGLRQTIVPKSRAHVHGEGLVGVAVAGFPITDIAATMLVSATPQYVDTLREHSAGARCVVVEQPYLFPAIAAAGVSVPVIHEAQNVESVLKRGVLPRVEVGARLAEIVERVEGDVTRSSVLTTTCSDLDARTLADEYGVDASRFVVIANGVDTGATPFVDLTARRRHRDRWLNTFEGDARVVSPITRVAIFLGSWHLPNIDAAEAILAFAPRRPETLFVLAGSHCAALAARGLPANVAPLGLISAATKRALLGAADVALNPMRLGSGTNLKMVEYLAAGVPVVTTAAGARGLPLQDPPFVIADVDSFPTAIAGTYADLLATERRARRGRELVEREFDWSELGRRFARVVAGAAA